MQRVPKSVHNSVNFCTPAATAYADALIILGSLRILGINIPPLWAPALALCALIYVLSMLMF